MINAVNRNVFSVSFDLILLDKKIPYCIYINSSKRKGLDHFVKIVKKDSYVTHADLNEYKRKYRYIYILEDERYLYLESLVSSGEFSEEEVVKVLKDSAIHYLEVLTDREEYSTELLSDVIDNCKDTVKNMVSTIGDKSVDQIQKLISSISYHDFYTFDHSVNVSMYCIGILNSLKKDVSDDLKVLIGLGGMLHDLGKLNVPTHVINNPGELSEAEFAYIKDHPLSGERILSDHDLEVEGVDFSIIKSMMTEHHENYNGTGYPNHLRKDEISLFARIVAIADFFDAITTQRAYHKALEVDNALAVMKNSSGAKLDPHIFEVFAKSASDAYKKGQLVKSVRENRRLPDDFEPSSPYLVLPFEKNYIKKDIFKNKSIINKSSKSRVSQNIKKVA